MKKFKLFAATLAAAAVLLSFPVNNSLEAAAAEPVTYAVKYLDSVNDWRFQSNTSEFNEEEGHRELYYMYQEMKDGDIVVVYNDSESASPLDLGSKRLSNLTVTPTSSFTIVTASNVDVLFALEGANCSVNANVNTANLYDDLTCNLGGNVGTLNFYINGEINSTVGCSGTVGHLYGYSISDDQLFYDYYSFQTDSLYIGDGGFQTPQDYFSYSAPATTPAPATPAPSTGSASGSDYDSVPKTGEGFGIMWLLLGAVLCAGGSVYTVKKAK